MFTAIAHYKMQFTPIQRLSGLFFGKAFCIVVREREIQGRIWGGNKIDLQNSVIKTLEVLMMAHLALWFRVRGSGKCWVNFVLITLIGTLCCASAFAAPQGPLGYFDPAGSSLGAADSIQSISQHIKELDQRIAAAKEELKQLVDQQQEAKQQLKELLQHKPQKPNNPAAMPEYNIALADWQKQVNAKQEAINTLQRAIDVKKAEIARLEKERESFARKVQ